jgi:hypothetical protein
VVAVAWTMPGPCKRSAPPASPKKWQRLDPKKPMVPLINRVESQALLGEFAGLGPCLMHARSSRQEPHQDPFVHDHLARNHHEESSVAVPRDVGRSRAEMPHKVLRVPSVRAPV